MTNVLGLQSERPDLRRWSVWISLTGLVTLAIGSLFSIERVWGNLLLVTFMLAGVGIGALFFLAFHGVTGARWSVPLLPAARSLAATLPWSGLAAGLVAAAGLSCYPWIESDFAHTSSFWFKTAWLSPAFFVVRSALYVLVWALVGSWMSAARFRGGAGRSALALVLLSVSLALAGFDWIMSLEPLWFSTMFGVYQFAGVFVSALAAIVLLTVRLKQEDRLSGADQQQLHDLGKLLFGFSCFWMYIWFSQYMLIWYVNIKEESVYFIDRMQGLWWPLMWLSLILNWGIPFFVLLPRPAKRSWRIMARVSLLILVGRWLDLYLMILPPLAGDQPVCGFPEVGGLLLVTGITLRVLCTGAGREPAAAASELSRAAPSS